MRPMRRCLRGMVGVCGVLAASAAGASEDQAPEEFDWPVEAFFLSDIPQIQEPGVVQTQAAFQLRNGSDTSQFDASLQGEVGIGHKLQLESEVEWSREHQSDTIERGLSEVSVGALLGLHESADTGFSLSSGLKAQLARPAFSDDRWAISARLLAFKQLGALGLNAELMPGFAYTRQHDYEPRVELGLAASWGSALFVPTVEVRAELADEAALEAVAGVKFKPTEAVELGAGALLGPHEDTTVYGAALSLLIELGG